MKKINVELVVGIFVLAGFFAFVYLSLRLGEFSIFSFSEDYPLVAEFASVAGLEKGAEVEIAGVPIGRVEQIHLADGSQAKVTLLISESVKITDDAIASVRTKGIIGDKYIKIMQGGAEEILKPGDVITETESAVDLEELISKYIFGDVSEK